MNLWALLGGLFAALLSGYFAACNHALMDYSRLRLAEILDRRGKSADVERLETHRHSLLLLTALLRALLDLLIFLAMVAIFWPTTGDQLHWTELLLAMFASAVAISIFAVAIPASWARYAAEPLLAFSLPFLVFTLKVFFPVMAVLHLFDPLLRRVLSVRSTTGDNAAPAESGILEAVSEGEKTGIVDESQKEMIHAVVSFPTMTVAQIMTPRTEILGLAADSTREEVRKVAAESGHSRLPVYDGDLDRIIGVLYVKDLITLPGGDADALDLKKISRHAVFVPQTKPLRDLLTQFKDLNIHIAIVLDEYGGTAGLVTIEDVLEQIVGDIRDEYEPVGKSEPGVSRLSDTVFEVTARTPISQLNTELGVSLPTEEDYDTLGGFVLSSLGRVPVVGEVVERGNLRMTVTEAERTRVNKVRIEVIPEGGAKNTET